VHGFPVWQQYHAQVSTFGIRHRGPASNTSISLDDFPFGIVDDVLNPFKLDRGTIGALSNRQEILGEFHFGSVANSFNEQP
jgi:hypothetical protein